MTGGKISDIKIAFKWKDDFFGNFSATDVWTRLGKENQEQPDQN